MWISPISPISPPPPPLGPFDSLLSTTEHRLPSLRSEPWLFVWTVRWGNSAHVHTVFMPQQDLGGLGLFSGRSTLEGKGRQLYLNQTLLLGLDSWIIPTLLILLETCKEGLHNSLLVAKGKRKAPERHILGVGKLWVSMTQRAKRTATSPFPNGLHMLQQLLLSSADSGCSASASAVVSLRVTKEWMKGWDKAPWMDQRCKRP